MPCTQTTHLSPRTIISSAQGTAIRLKIHGPQDANRTPNQWVMA